MSIKFQKFDVLPEIETLKNGEIGKLLVEGL